MLTGVVLTKNESENIEKCLKSLSFCDQVYIVDDNSTDNTVKLAKANGAKILTHALNNDFAAQHNWALQEIKSPWILFIDADEIVSPLLASEIKSAIEKIEYKGYLIPRIDHLWGRELKHGDLGGVKVLRLARRGAGLWKGKVHESWEIDGKIDKLKNPIDHYPHQGLVEFLQHINAYSTIKANEFYENKRKTNMLEIICAPIIRFKILYFFKLGFLDGTAGFIHAMTMAFYAFLVTGKLYLRYKGIPK